MMKLKNKNVSINLVKHSFAQRFPDSPLIPVLMSLPDEVEGDELIGAVGVWLNFLDVERTNNLREGK